MDLVLAALIAVGGCVALSTWRFVRRRASTRAARLPASSPAPEEPRGLEDLRPADVLVHDRTDLIVSGVARFVEGAELWQECRAEGDAGERWLVVRPSDPEFLWIGARKADVLSGTPPPASLEHEGKIYQLERVGRASVTAAGELGGSISAFECHYWDYSRPGADRLWIRRGPSGCSTFQGQRVKRHLVSLLPGS